MRGVEGSARMTEMRNAYISVGTHKGKRPLKISRFGWENNIEMDLKQVVYEGVDWILLAQNRNNWRALVNTIMKLWFNKKLGIYW
jgi:hypothetical protein